MLTPNCKGGGSALQSFLKVGAEGNLFPFHRKPNIVPGGFKCHRNRAVIPFFPLTATPWDRICCLHSILFNRKAPPEPRLHTRAGQTGHTGFLNIYNTRANVMSHLCRPLPKHWDCPFSLVVPGTALPWEDRGMLWSPLSFASSTVTLSPPCHLGWHRSDANSNPCSLKARSQVLLF